jgi:hypothetical protein
MAATFTDKKPLNGVPGRGGDPAMGADESVRCLNDHGIPLVRLLCTPTQKQAQEPGRDRGI